MSSRLVVRTAIVVVAFNIIFMVVVIAISVAVLSEPHGEKADTDKDLKVIQNLPLPIEEKSDKEAVLTWYNGSDTGYDRNDIEYNDGIFTVKVEGYYYIYSTIRYNGSGTEELDYGRIVHRIEKADEQTSESRKRTPSTLMQNFKSTPVIRRGRLAYTTSSLAGTFFLPKRSKLSVYSSIPDNIDKSPRGTIFGLFLM